MGHVTHLVFHLVPTNFPSHDDYFRLSSLSFLELGDKRFAQVLVMIGDFTMLYLLLAQGLYVIN